MRLKSDGKLGIGANNNDSYDTNARNLLLASSGNTGITIRSGGSSNYAMIHFADGTSGVAQQRAGRILYEHSTDSLQIATANTIRLRIDSDGLKFGTDSAAANALDDYEEGTWTPNQGAGLTVVGTFTSSGKYTKIGRLVHIAGIVGGATSVTMSSTDQDILSNNPFVPAGGFRASGLAINQAIGASAGLSVIPGAGRIIIAETMATTTNIYFSATYSI